MNASSHFMPKSRFLPLLACAALLALAGCTRNTGNGTSDGSLPASTAPAATVPAPSYASNDPRLDIFNKLNSFRAALGVGQLTQNPNLDTSAGSHANYLNLNGVETHDEVHGNPGFFADNPHDRGLQAGMGSNAWEGELIGDASTCIDQLLDTVYHLEALTSSAEQIGIGIGGNWVCVLVGATVTGTAGTQPPANGIPLWGGQQIADTAVVVSPYSGQTGVAPAMSQGENPRPVPQYANPGHPVMVRVRADGQDELSVSGFSLSDSTGNPVVGTILVAPNAIFDSTAVGATQDDYVVDGVAFFVPASPLAAATTYTAVFSGARDGKAVAQTWSFTTQ